MNDKRIDPEIASLLGDSSVPDFSKLFGETSHTKESTQKEPPPDDFSKEHFSVITKWEQDSDPLFFDQDYYSKILTGEGEVSQRFHTLLQKFLKCEDPQERSVYRQRLIPAWWELLRSLSTHYAGSNIEKRWALRYGYILPTLITNEQRQMLSKIVTKKEYEEPIHYIDEWMDMLLDGRINPLATDDTPTSKTNPQTKTKVQLEKTQGLKDANYTLLLNLLSERDRIEKNLNGKIQSIIRHSANPSIKNATNPYTSEQKTSLNRTFELLRKLSKLDREIAISSEKVKSASTQIDQIGEKLQSLGGISQADQSTMENELDSIRQIAKLCVGRQGNHFPFLMKNFFGSSMQLIATRENVIQCMSQVEEIDPGLFRRTFRQKTARIVPHTIIVPCYGDKGVCWEPFERFNRATSRGRIAIPMFPNNVQIAVTYALGDLRWNIAKEKAAHYWMEEGLTGHYYQWFSSQKHRGNVRLFFLEDYMLWVTKEVNGLQKLDREVRGIFWRHIPFTQSVKDNLRNRGFVYDELYKKDMNRKMSDGY